MNIQKWARWGACGLLGAALVAPAARAQGNTAPQGPSGEQRADLQLSNDQKTKMQEIHKSEQEQIKAVRNDQSLTAEQKREKIKEINRNSDQQIKGVLSPEQYRRYERRAHDRRQDRREDRRDRRRGKRPPQSR